MRVVGWTALAFAGLTLTAGLAHADDGVALAPEQAETATSTAPTSTEAPTAATESPAASVDRAPAPAEVRPAVPSAPSDQAVPADDTAGADVENGPSSLPATTVDSARTASSEGTAVAEQPTEGAGKKAGTSTDEVAEQADESPAETGTAPALPGDEAGSDLGTEPETASGTDSESTLGTAPETALGTDPAADATPETVDETDALSPEDGTPQTESGEEVTGEDLETVLLDGTGRGIDLSAADQLLPQEAAPQAATPTALASATKTAAAPASVAKSSVKSGFKDVPAGMMYRDEILWMQQKGYAKGWPDGTFRPLEDINRDAFVAMLYRVHAPKNYVAPKRSLFIDVQTNNMFYREISWAAQTGVTSGWADGTFRPLDPINRDAALAMLHRSYGGGTAAPGRSPFVDIAPGTEHYEAMAWGFANGVTTGWDNGTFRPRDQIHRDAVAVMIHRLEVLGTDSQRGLTSGPTGTHWASTGGKSKIGNPTGYQYRYGTGLRQDFQRGSVLYSPHSKASVLLSGTFKQTYDSRGGQRTFGMPISPQISAAGSVGLQFDKGGIYTTDGFTFSVTGSVYNYYRSLGGMTSYLGAPIGNQRTGSTGIDYQSFKGGQLTSYMFRDTPPPSTPAGTKMPAYRTLQVGSRDYKGNDQVHAVQVKVGVPADGVFGAQTRTAVMAYQRSHGLPATGIVDARTWSRIISSPNTTFNGSNGRLAAHQLTVIAPNWTLPNAAAAPFLAMQKAFTAETGRTFKLNDAYRPIDRQIQMLVLYGRPRAAYPGTSPHGHAHRGAVDIQVTRGDATHTWLVRNASRFGFGQTSWQAANEPWHWERR